MSAEKMAKNIDEIAKKSSDPERAQKLFDFAAEMINSISDFSFCDGELVKSDDGSEKFVGSLIKSIDDLDYFLGLDVLKLVAERSREFDISSVFLGIVNFHTIENEIKKKTQNEINKKFSSVMKKVVEYVSLKLSHDQYRCRTDKNFFIAEMGGFWCNILNWCNNTETVLKVCNELTESVYITLRLRFFNCMLEKINLNEMPTTTKIKRSLLDYLVKENLEKTKQMNLNKFKKILMLYMNSDDNKNIPFDRLVSFLAPECDQKTARELIFSLNHDDKDKEINIFLRLLFKIKHLFNELVGFLFGSKKDEPKQINCVDWTDKNHIKNKNGVLIKSNEQCFKQKSKPKKDIHDVINSEKASQIIN